MPRPTRLKEQLQGNAVALISLVIAISSLAYNTWRNEASEYNRNQRLISMEVLRNVGELQQVVRLHDQVLHGLGRFREGVPVKFS